MLLALGILLVAGSLELLWKSGRIVDWQQRRLQQWKQQSPRWLLETYALGGFLGPQLQRAGLVAAGILGLPTGLAMLAAALGTVAT